MADPFIAEVSLFAGNFAPRGWAFCSGQLLSIAQNAALFSLLGTTYGGDGRTTFGLPDLKGRVPIGPGTGTGLSNRSLGEKGGLHETVLSVNQIPSHNHPAGSATVQVTEEDASTEEGSGASIAGVAGATAYASGPATEDLGPGMISGQTGSTGNNIPYNNMQPYLVLNYIIATVGTFPSRN